MTRFSILLLSACAALALATAPVSAQDASDIDFGDDSGSWTEDGECDDPRFVGEGMASSTSRSDILKDATDCKVLFDDGKITFSDKQYDPELAVLNGTDLGDNSYEWANDDQCDDARFQGEGMAITPTRAAIKKDRNDCSYGFQTGALTLADALPDPVETVYRDIDFGHDKSSYAGDNECDDPRFFGAGMSSIALSIENIGGDRKDCLAAFKDGTIILKAEHVIDGVFFGDDSGFYADDGECDDLRFTGRAMGVKPTPASVEKDATDCMAAWRKKRISRVEKIDINGYLIQDGIVFGYDSSNYANDNECDDPRFTGKGMASSPSSEYIGKDRSDCLAGYEAATLKLAPLIPVDNTIRVDGIRFGDDEGSFSKDGECDDPRFTGQGMATALNDSDLGHDATDCLSLYQSGDIALK